MAYSPFLLLAALLLLGGVALSKASARLGVPSLLLFLGLGMLAGSDGLLGVAFDDFDLSRRVGIVALAYILFSGGLDTNLPQIRRVLAPGLVLASAGVLVTALVLGSLASLVLDLTLAEGLLLGAVTASTDAAAVFTILRARGVPISGRLRSLLELESGSNDPAAVFLTVAMIGIVLDGGADGVSLAVALLMQMGIGVAAGFALARAAALLINRMRLEYEGLYPVLTFAFVLLCYEGVTALGGSGFVATYAAGVTLAGTDFLHKRSLTRFHDAVAWLMQISMFVLLGLLVFPSQLDDVAGPALAAAAILMFVARPLAVAVSLLWFRPSWRETAFVSWVGLRGATPIILATFPVAAGVADATTIFHVVFFVVLASVLVQGTTIPAAARLLGIVDGGSAPPDVVSFDAVIAGDGTPKLRELTLVGGAPAIGRAVVQLELPHGVLLVLVGRGDTTFMPQGGTVLLEGDRLLVLSEPMLFATVDHLFVPRSGRPEPSPDPG